MQNDQLTKLATTILRRRIAEPKRGGKVIAPSDRETAVSIAVLAGSKVEPRGVQAAVTASIDDSLSRCEWIDPPDPVAEALGAFVAYASPPETPEAPETPEPLTVEDEQANAQAAGAAVEPSHEPSVDRPAVQEGKRRGGRRKKQ